MSTNINHIYVQYKKYCNKCLFKTLVPFSSQIFTSSGPCSLFSHDLSGLVARRLLLRNSVHLINFQGGPQPLRRLTLRIPLPTLIFNGQAVAREILARKLK